MHYLRTSYWAVKQERFPRATDKERLLEYAFYQAQACERNQDAGLVLGVGVVVTHPFAFGNGGSSRGIYAEASVGWNVGSDILGANFNRPRPRMDQTITLDYASRAIVDLGSAFHSDPLYTTAELLVRQARGMGKPNKRAFDIGLWRMPYPDSTPRTRNSLGKTSHLHDQPADERFEWHDSEFEGLSLEEEFDLQDAIGLSPSGKDYDHDFRGVHFALEQLLHEGILPRDIVKTYTANNYRTIEYINIFDVLSTLDVTGRKLLVQCLWDYRRDLAQAKIDMASPASVSPIRPKSTARKYRALVLKHTNNLSGLKGYNASEFSV